ncbi:MAG: hydrolase [Planctomycetota bacterium]|nr:MAG: hydrolase [Planctomycetota bacterium]
MFDIDNTVLVLVDVQGKLAQLMADKDELFINLQRMVKGAQALNLPILWMEQIPEKLGETIPELQQLLPKQSPLAKKSFSCTGKDEFNKALKESGRKQVLIMGIETHICVYQTALDLVADGFEVEVVSDAVSSRVAANKDLALRKMQDCGVGLTSTEMILFELMRSSEHGAFRDIQNAIK